MRHQSENVSGPIADSRDILDGAVRVCGWIQPALWRRVTQNDLPALVQFSQRHFIREKTTLSVSDGQTQKRPLRATVGKKRISHLDPRRRHFANEVERTVPN
jgi:hypothetical protein